MRDSRGKNPGSIAVLAGTVVAIDCTAITIISDYLSKTQQAEIDASLKHALLECSRARAPRSLQSAAERNSKVSPGTAKAIPVMASAAPTPRARPVT